MQTFRHLWRLASAVCLFWLAVSSLPLRGGEAESKTSRPNTTARDGVACIPVPVPEFAKDLRSQKNWIDRFKATKDWRLLYFLAARSGVPVNPENAKKASEFMKEAAGETDKILETFNILMDYTKHVEDRTEEWRTKFGDQAVAEDTEHYRILATKADDLLLGYLKAYMDLFYKSYAMLLPADEPVDGKFLVCVFPDEAGYLATEPPPNSHGYYRARERSLVTFGDPKRRKDQRWITETCLDTIRHEGAHQYIGYYIPNCPPWLDEGLATFMESACISGRKIEWKDRSASRYAKALQKGKQLVRLQDFVRLDYPSFHAPERQSLHYNQAWAFVHFLLFYDGANKRAYREILPLSLSALRGGTWPGNLADEVFKTIDMKALEADFADYMSKLRPSEVRNRYVLQ